MKTLKQLLILTACCGMLPPISGALAKEFRSIKPINAAAVMPEGAQPPREFKPVPGELVDQAVEKLMASWGSPQMQDYLSKSFFDKDRLSDVIDTLVPRDATIRILSVQGVQTLQQWEEPNPVEPAGMLRVSRVSVVVRTQLEFTRPDGVLETKPGTTEYILKFKERIEGEGA
ncbi:hypothetical protein [Congregibacter litoralis]|uniref:Uncharacterized protein n=1 Tax=Congregibacter litoralis KT71 TaxID=314285 RepID=A4ABP8_9GAMM|nr:hypothetical protein [Congregibacter litoralis]EAQ96561.2 hypothetical protein KT71_06037 [Congregibacter litoralis KT71]